jgi:hypothetical protein
MTVRFAQWTLDVQDVALMVDFWSEALDFEVRHGDDGSAKLYPPADVRRARRPGRQRILRPTPRTTFVLNLPARVP